MSTEPENQISAAIDDAGPVRDPLDGLVDRATADPAAPFAIDSLQHLAALRAGDRAAFEVLRAKLRGAGVRVTALDEAIAEESGEGSDVARSKPIC
jgi:hypothetical protein